MKIWYMISPLIITSVLISGCANISSNKLASIDNNVEKTGAVDKLPKKKNADVKQSEMKQEVYLDHIKISVSNKWSVNKGLDSVSFSINGKSIGVIEGLAYSDSLESLLPNQAIVIKKQKLNNLPFNAYEVNTSSDAVQTKTRKETHLYIFIEPKKEVYDLHFDSSSVDQSTILQIVASTVIIE